MIKTIVLVITLGAPELGPVGTIELTGFDSMHRCVEVSRTYQTDLDELLTECKEVTQ